MPIPIKVHKSCITNKPFLNWIILTLSDNGLHKQMNGFKDLFLSKALHYKECRMISFKSTKFLVELYFKATKLCSFVLSVAERALASVIEKCKQPD